MLRATRNGGLHIFRIWTSRVSFSSTAVISSASQVNAPLKLDPTLKAFLDGADISLSAQKTHSISPQELEVLNPEFPNYQENTDHPVQGEEEPEDDLPRKSPAASFGSRHIGQVVLPVELQSSISLLISESDRRLLHNDAKRLFYDESAKLSEGVWTPQYDKRYRSWQQMTRHTERDGTAFASVVLPAHYSAIMSVFHHLAGRLGSDWKPTRILDWGAGTGSGLWASLYSFQKTALIEDSDVQDLRISNSIIKSYIGIERREGLVSIGKRLLRDIPTDVLRIDWQKSFREENQVSMEESFETVAISAFLLTSLQNSLSRKKVVKEMWESGAETMVLIDHNTKAGFEAIAEARELLLKMGRKEETSPRDADGSHVVAPCPHDKACPLYHPGYTKLNCGFSQRIQRPKFVRLTKHSNIGHEDIEYSYVVVKRGPRPPVANTTVGRTGLIGKWAANKKLNAVTELSLHDCQEIPGLSKPIDGAVGTSYEPTTSKALESALQLEAYHWPRLIFPPLKRGGHVILDSCTPEGKIMRMTVPKSQGKQPYYDARKSAWGDIFPHAPKNPPQERSQKFFKRGGEVIPSSGADIGKRHGFEKRRERVGYDAISREIKEKRRASRKEKYHLLREVVNTDQSE